MVNVENTSDPADWRQRELLLRRAQHDLESLAYTYERYYQAAKVAGVLAWFATALTAIIGGVLVYVITSQAIRFPFLGRYLAGSGDMLSMLLLTVSLLNAFYSPQARSARYYRAGQDFQELYGEFDNFVDLEIADLNREVSQLKDEYERLHRRRHQQNQSAPQLSGLWYRTNSWEFRLINSLRQVTSSRHWKDNSTSDEDTDDEADASELWEETLEQKVSKHSCDYNSK